MTEQEKQKLKDTLIEHKNIASSEYGDEDAFVGIYFCDLVDIINKVMHNIGWHPASEWPTVDKETGLSDEVIAIQDRFYDGERVIYTRIVGSGWKHDNIKWWCYPPMED